MGARRVALRIAYRDALAHKVRSLLVILLVGLPVLVVTFAMVFGRTADVDAAEGIDRAIGAADALVAPGTLGPIAQGSDALNSFWESRSMFTGADDGTEEYAAPTVEDLRAVLGPDTRIVEFRTGGVGMRGVEGAVYPDVTEVDVTDPLAAPLFDVVQGELPQGADEVMVSQAFLDAVGRAVGDRLDLRGEGYGNPVIVGVAESTDKSGAWVLGRMGSVLSQDSEPSWLVDSRPVLWEDVVELNDVGFLVHSRAVIEDPPADDDIYPELWFEAGSYDAGLGVAIALIVVMVVMEVALLAGPALAVTARQQSRTLALVAAAGGTPSHARLVVIAQGLVLGVGASVFAAALGVGLAWPATQVAGRLDTYQRFGPFDVPFSWVLGVVSVGVVAVLMAAVVPAWLTARQDPVQALAGRRADGAVSRANPVIGIVVVGAGVALTILGTHRSDYPVIPIVLGTVIVVLGALFLIPTLVVWSARLLSGATLSVRFAGRDAARHRGRTVPAVAAVMATVAGVMAVGITIASEGARDEAYHTPVLPAAQSIISWWVPDVAGADGSAVPVDEYVEVLTGAGYEPEVLVGLSQFEGQNDAGQYRSETWTIEDAEGPAAGYLWDQVGVLGSTIVVDDASILVADYAVRTEVTRLLEAGTVVSLVSSPEPAVEERRTGDRLVHTRVTDDESGDGIVEKVREVEVDVAYVVVWGTPNVSLLVPSSVVREHDLPVTPAAIWVEDGIAASDEGDLEDEMTEIDGMFEINVETERDYQSMETQWVLLLLAGGGGVLMLAGTLTATFLALSDARPDLATLGAIGASPRMRRGVAGAYALVISVMGAGLGVLVGMVPGFAAAWASTRQVIPGDWEASVDGPYFAMPWWLLGVMLVVLPLLCAAVMWLSARSRLPMVARID